MRPAPDADDAVWVGEALDVDWVPWLLDEALRRGVELRAARCTEEVWREVAPAVVGELFLAEARVVQRLGCGGVRTEVRAWTHDGDALCLAAHCSEVGEPWGWRVLTLEALVLASDVEPLAAK